MLHSEPAARYRRWLDETQRAIYGVDLPYLTALIRRGSYIPDFLTPTPLTTDLTFEEEIERLVALSDELIRDNIQKLVQSGGDSEVVQHFLMYPHDALYCLVEELRLYWQRTLERHWPRITDVLDDDIIYHARKMALGGINDLFVDFHPQMRYTSGEVQLLNKTPHDGVTEYYLRGDGLQLVPSSFAAAHVMYQIESAWQPMLIYDSRGTGYHLTTKGEHLLALFDGEYR